MSTIDQLLWHVEQVCGPLSRESHVVPGDDDRSILEHNFRAILASPTTPQASSAEGMRERILPIVRGCNKAHGMYGYREQDCLDAADDILAALRSSGEGWQAIESAPKDGTDIMVVVAGNHSATGKPFIPEVVNWSEEDGWWNPMWGWDKAHSEYLPTHWRPLPSPPRTEKGGE